MPIPCIKPYMTILFSLYLSGCIVNPTPNAGSFSMTDAQTKAAQYTVLQTQNTDREAHKGILRDEAEVRAWERNISKPNTVILSPPRY